MDDPEGNQMPPFKLNVARIQGLPAAKDLARALTRGDTASDDRFRLISCEESIGSVTATVVYRTREEVCQLGSDGHSLKTGVVDRVFPYPLQITPGKERMEVYAGSANGIRRIQEFLTARLQAPVLAEAAELDVARAVAKLSGRLERFMLQSVRLEGYSPKSYMSGVFCPRFADSEHGIEFLSEHSDAAVLAHIRFAGANGLVSATISRKACFVYSCDHDDREFVRSVFQRLI
jgi:hypothetical protein